jgi:hypothetical protein
MSKRPLYILGVFLHLLAGWALPAYSHFDPLDVSHGGEPEILDLAITDKQREREIPLRV